MLKYALAGCLALALTTGVQSWRLDRVKGELTRKNIEIAALQEFKRVAVDDAQIQADQCQARVDEARASAIRIERIYDRPIHVDPTGCAVRSIVGADELREALQPDTPAP